jgi:F-type H+-transporting ATPase subunit alpha
MTNFTDLTRVLEEQIENWEGKPSAGSIGFVTQVGDSVATVYGLSRAVYGELVEFASGAVGIVLNLEEDGVGCVLLSGESLVRDEEEVRGTGKVVSVAAAESLLGRVVNPLGQPIDGKGALEGGDSPADIQQLPVESPAPPVIDRGSVNQPLQTGSLAVDAMIPIGRGQRELIIGDRQTGKTALALDAIINQKGKGVYCVYCAIGQKASSVAAIIKNLERFGAMDYTFVVLASASDSAAFQYLAPYSACAMAEYFMHKGKDVLIVYDDLSKHAVAYRTISLLLRRPPGREAFPGDVFYLHSRLLERAAKLSAEKGGGSITALPIVETQGGDISSYIPTNVISITDGQVFLDSELFNSGFRPAIDVGLSVSRVGGTAQAKAVRKIAGRLRLDLAQYREMAAFAQFGSDLDKTTQDKLAQGERIMEALKQPQFTPWAMEEQVAILFIAVNGHLKDISTAEVGSFIKEFVEYLKTSYWELLETIERTGEIVMDQEQELSDAVEEFKRSFKIPERSQTPGIQPGSQQ